MTTSADRRPLKTRSKAWVDSFTKLLLKTGITPNQVSLLSIVFALAGAASFYFSQSQPFLLFAAAACIQLRLLANMMDGLLATEGGKGTKNGQLFNEVPDRFTDILFLASAGYATGTSLGILLGWLSSCGALMTAYIRLHGAVINQGEHDFRGPCAKPQRMFLLTLGALLAAAFANHQILVGSLVLITIGTFLTFFRRTIRLSHQLETGK